MPADVAVQLALARIVLAPVSEIGQTRLALSQLIEQMPFDVGGVRVARIAPQRRLDVPHTVVVLLQLDLGKGEHCTEPPVVAVCRRRSEEHTSELQSRQYLVCRLLLEKKYNYIASRSSRHSVTSRDCML